IIVGGTGLYFTALTEGLSEIPDVPAAIRAEADALPLENLLDEIDPVTRAGLDTANRARVQRAWEVARATGKPLHHWQGRRQAPILPRDGTTAIVIETTPEQLNPRIVQRFDKMLDQGALDEVRAMQPLYDPTLPAFRAIGVPELTAHLKGHLSIAESRERTIIATRQFAKRQRTWFRSKMSNWQKAIPAY
ncbi:MAG: tRNA (adenosine(37)-N6)-dimethylallyltransferase, partial [Arenibacterium sp.]